jgi:hypothetical protein
MAQTVYVVTSGSYSDFGINAMFSTREKAEEYMGGHPDQFNDIQEYELDTEPPRLFGTCWMKALRLDGSVYEFGSWNMILEVDEECRQGERGKGWTTCFDGMHCAHDQGWFCGKSFVSDEHALKLAIEQRQKAQREHPEWFRARG